MIYLLAALLAVSAPTAFLVDLSVHREASSATVTIAVAGTFRHTTHHWIGDTNTLVVDIYPARLTAKPGTYYSDQHLRVRIGQFQQLTARVVIESKQPFVWSVKRPPEGLRAHIWFPRLAPPPTPLNPSRPAPSQDQPTPSPPRPAATPSPQPSPQAPPPPTPTFSIHAVGSLQTVAQTIAAITGARIEVDPSIAHRPVALRLPRATLQQALAEIVRQTGARWTVLPDGAIRISP